MKKGKTMKIRHANCRRLVREKMLRQLALDTQSPSVDESRCEGDEGNSASANKFKGSSLTHVKLYRRGEGCEMPDDAQFLIVVSQGFDANGELLPVHVQTAQTFPQLKEQLREIAANTGSFVIKASGHFERLALELGLRHLTSEWGKL